ncbi:hypothetical protein JXA05_00080, partial [Candidatus Peregrinibacteria bacterium]|nr:hypothetical protein [Candidatus Peregrinibacteria bacterium]
MKNHLTKIFFLAAVFVWGASAAYAAGFSDYYNPGSAESCPKVYQAFDCSPGYIISSTGTCKTKSEMDSKYASCQTYQKNSQKMGLQCDFRCKWAADPNSPSCASLHKTFDPYNTSGACGTCLSGYVEYNGTCQPTSEVIYVAGVGFLGRMIGEIGSQFVNIFEPDSPDCGNGQLDGLEQCDGSQFVQNTCSEASAGVFIDTGSTLACTGSCVYDFTGCKRPAETTALCNNGSIDVGEECDPGVNTQPKKCSEINSFYVDDAAQTATCNNNCSWQVTQCQYKTGGATITDPEPPPAEQRRHYFITANKYTGNLGGQAGADTKCNSDPKARNGVIYRALLATPSRIENEQIVSEAIYFGSVGEYWEGEDGSGYIGTDEYTTRTPPNHAMALEPFRLSYADADDGVNEDEYCNCYGLGDTRGLSRAGFLAGKMGNVSYDYAYFYAHGCQNTKTISCSTNLPLLCVEDYKQSEAPPPPPSWHYFITTNAYTGNLGGQSGADAKCNSDPNRMPGRIYQAWI